MKKIKLNINQLNEVLNVAVDVQNNDVNNSIRKAKSETDKSVGSGVERNYVISGDEINEDNADGNIFISCINTLINNIHNNPDAESMYLNGVGYLNLNEIFDTLDEIYFNLTNGKSLYDDRKAYREMKQTIKDNIDRIENAMFKNENKIFSKKQIEESRLKNLNKRYTFLTKRELKENFNKKNRII